MAPWHLVLAPNALVNGVELVLGWNAPRKAHSTQNNNGSTTMILPL